MKKITLLLTTILLSLTFHPLLSNATTNVVASEQTQSAKAKILLTRLNEIKEMDKSNLKSSDKKILRTEVRSIRDQLKVMDGGIYLSVGAIIIILLLLIIIF